ncbi:hypothetical protein L2D01_04385 [Hyphomonadaceae bacterium ML37]|nr:hypothetical protein L2D01_04385 [Hyphomonadaceae bacterium ML37]
MTKFITALIVAFVFALQAQFAGFGGANGAQSPMANGEDPDGILCWLIPSLCHHHH